MHLRLIADLAAPLAFEVTIELVIPFVVFTIIGYGLNAL